MKLLIIVACTLAGELTSTHADVGETVDVTKDDAATLTRMGRAMYLDKADDPTKGALTATAEDKANIKAQVKAIETATAAREAQAQAQSPASLGAQIADAIAKGVAAALSAKAASAPAA